MKNKEVTKEKEEKKDKTIVIIYNTILITVLIIICLAVTKTFLTPKEKIDLTSDEAKTVASETMKKYYTNVFDSHSARYCGGVDYSDSYELYYMKSKTYNTIEEAKNFFKTFLSEKYINDNLITKYKEKNNKLYCLDSKVTSLEYEENSFEITKIDEYKEQIELEGRYKTKETEQNPSETYDVKVTIIRENDNWVIDKYTETFKKLEDN